MLIKVKPKVKMDGSCTWTSYFVRFLLKICFFPLYIKGERLVFSFLSWKTLVHLSISIGVYNLFGILGMYLSGFVENIMENLSIVSLFRKLFYI